MLTIEPMDDQILITDRSLSLDKIEQDLAKTFLGKHGVRVD